MIYNKYTCEVSHPQLRREFIGSSDASAIMGVSPWDTPLTLWETKLGLKPPKDINYSMARGIELEQAARDHIFSVTGIKFFPKRVFSNEYPWMMANLDGMSESYSESLEIKCPGDKDHLTALSGKVPEKYFFQMQHQMIVTGHTQMYYLSYNEINPVILVIPFCPIYQKQLILNEEKFYKCLEDFIEPEKTERDYIKRNDVAWREAALRYQTTHEYHKQIERELEDARKALIEMAESQSSTGCGVKVVKSMRKGNVQYSKIPEIQHIDLDYYRSMPTLQWRIITNGENNVS